MESFANLKLTGKLAFPAGLIALAVFVIGWQAIGALEMTRSAAEQALQGPVGALIHAESAAYHFNSLTRDDRDFVLAYSVDARLQAKKHLAQDLDATRAALDNLERGEIRPERLALTEQARAKIGQFVDLDNRAFALSSEGNRDDAFAILSGDSVRIFNQSSDILSKIVEANKADIALAREGIASTISKVLYTIALCAGIGFSIGFGALAAIAVGQIARPIGRVTMGLKALAEGNLAVEVTGTARTDEVGILSQALASLKEQMSEADALRARHAAEKAVREVRAGTIESLALAFDQTVCSTLEAAIVAAGEMQDAAAEQAALSARTDQDMVAIAAASKESSLRVEAVVTAAQDLSASIDDIGRHVQKSAEVSKAAALETSQTNDKVLALAKAADRISEVVELISNIAHQTNLLALNATIEAARAGAAGRGFAVVADEVKGLANETARATGEISAQISAVQEETRRAVEAIHAIGSVIGEVHRISSSVAASIEAQGVATTTITHNVTLAAKATSLVSTSIADVARAAKTTSGIAEKNQTSAALLVKNAGSLRYDVTQFLDNVRAA